jgi:uncharacterized membrane-anchored protein YhcB (DUF1043 family)
MTSTKDRILIGAIIILILLLIGGEIRSNIIQSGLIDKIKEGDEIIVKMDEMKKESEGQYAKLVDYFNSEKDLNKKLREDNKDLQKEIKKQGEKLLMISDAVITLDGKISEGSIEVDEQDTTAFNMNLTYPDPESPFINWKGKIFPERKAYIGEWKFNELPLKIVLTETQRGLWNTRVIGPEWMKLDSLQVNSLPPEEFSPKREITKIGLLVGGGYARSLRPNGTDAFSVGVGMHILDKHIVMLNGTTNQELSINYLYKLDFKKK